MPQKCIFSIKLWENLDLCVGKVISCERKAHTPNLSTQIGWVEQRDVFPRIMLNGRFLTNTKLETCVLLLYIYCLYHILCHYSSFVSTKQ